MKYRGLDIEAEVGGEQVILKRAVKNNIKVSTKEFCSLQNDSRLLSMFSESRLLEKT